MRGTGWVIVAASAAVVALSGCSGADPEPRAASSSSATSPSASVTPAPTSSAVTTPATAIPPLPPEATTEDNLGAAAFVNHWFDLLNYAYRSGDSAPFMSASRSECSECQDFAQLVKELQVAGKHARSDVFEAVGPVAPPMDGSTLNVSIGLRQFPAEIVDREGQVEVIPSVPDELLTAVVRWDNNRWSMLGIAK